MTRKTTLDDILDHGALDTVEIMGDEEETLRLPRDAMTRDAEEEATFTPPAHLPEIKVEPGYVARWVRVSTFGEADANNFAARSQEGWMPIDPSENPDLARRCAFHKSDSSTSSMIVIGGLVACKMTRKQAEARAAYYEAQAKGAFASEVAKMKGAADRKMPMGVIEQNFRSSRTLDD